MAEKRKIAASKRTQTHPPHTHKHTIFVSNSFTHFLTHSQTHTNTLTLSLAHTLTYNRLTHNDAQTLTSDFEWVIFQTC